MKFPAFELPLPRLSANRAAIFLTIAVAFFISPLQAAPDSEENEQGDPAHPFIENLPATQNLPRVKSQARSVSAFGLGRLNGSAVIAHPWKALGPFPIPNGQTQNRVDPVSGRVTAIAIHPTSADIVYVGAAQGGVYRSLNGGASWTQLMDNAASGLIGTPLAIGAITIDPTDPTTVFVGTGEGNLSQDSFFGTGMYIITNADSFNPIVHGPYNLNSGSADVFTGRSIVAIAVDPTNHNNVFCATSSGQGGIFPTANAILPARGLYRTTNAFDGISSIGTPTFALLSVNAAEPNVIVTSVVVDPSNGNNLLCNLLSQTSGGARGGIYLSTNALSATPTFTRTQALLDFTNVKFAINRVGGVVTVYATAGDTGFGGSNSGTLYKSVNGGASFSQITSVNGFAGAQAFYDIALGLDPTNSSNVYVGGNTGNNILRRSTDGGATFPASPTGLHADVHAIAVSASNPAVVYHGNDGGIWRSNDSGANWISLNNGTFSATQFSGLALHPSDRNFSLGGTQDNGTEFLRPDASFIRADFGDGGFSLIDQNAANTTAVTMYHTYFNQTNNLLATARVDNVANAMENGWSVFGFGGTPNGILGTDAVNFYAPMTLGPGTPNIWYYGSDKLYRSIDQAATATIVSQVFQSTIPVSAIAICPQDDNVRVVGLNNGKVFATTLGTTPMLQIAGTGATNGTTTTPAQAVGRIIIDPNNKAVAYLAFCGSGSGVARVWKTTNLDAINLPTGIVTFAPMATGLPDISANAFAIDPQSGSVGVNSSDIYVGTDYGVYFSNNGGASWSVYGSGMPHVSVFGLEIQNNSRVLRAATHGRGLYETFVDRQAATPVLSKVESRKTHGSVGVQNIVMPLTGPTGIEDRSGGSYDIVFTFTTPVASGTASVGSGTATVGPITFNGNEMTVTLNAVTDAEVVGLNVLNVNGSLPSASVNLGFLVGDASADRITNGGDTVIVRNASGQVVDSTNFRLDLNADGFINGADTAIVRPRSGNSIP